MAKARAKVKKSIARLADGTEIQYLEEVAGEGSEGIVHFSSDRSSVIKFYKDDSDSNDPERRERIENIISKYNPTIDPKSGAYWKNIYCWPEGLIVSPRLGVRYPSWPKNFFMSDGREKKLSWFINPKSRKYVSPQDRGNWLGHIQMCILMARATRRLHSAGLAHSDLSYNNFLGDPVHGTLLTIDLDGLVVPGFHPPKVAGTPGLIAPEVVMGIVEPSIRTDMHALAVLIYQTLLFRHPLRGPKEHSKSPEEDERLMLGKNALFIEHPTDRSNRPRQKFTGFECLGPFLSEVIMQAFVKGLHDPDNRPTALDWEQALVRTTDIIFPCSNPKCEAKWFVVAQYNRFTCPFCGQKIQYPYIPVMLFYKEQAGKPGNFINEKHSLVAWSGQYLYKWHVFDNIYPGENADKTPQGYIVFHEGAWFLYNMDMDAKIIENGSPRTLPRNQYTQLKDGMQIRLSTAEHGRLALVQFLKV